MGLATIAERGMRIPRRIFGRGFGNSSKSLRHQIAAALSGVA